MTALLANVTNTDLPTSKQSCIERTNKMIRQQAEKIVLSPRGVNQVPPEQQYTLRELDVPEYNIKPTFMNLLNNRRYVIEQGFERPHNFPECKLPYAVHKAFALQVFTTSCCKETKFFHHVIWQHRALHLVLCQFIVGQIIYL